jgi:hypothetical protein
MFVYLAQIRTETGSQARVKVNEGVVRDYAEAMKRQLADGGLRFPPITVFTEGQDYWLGDGWHRVLAARKLGLTDIAAEVQSGSERDARLCAISANSAHGLPRSYADKRKAVGLLLGDAEWSQWSDREIARRCQVHHDLVSQLRRRASGQNRQIEKRKVRRGNKVYEMSVAASTTTAGEEAASTSPQSAALDERVIATDPQGIPVPKERAQVFATLADFQEAKDLFVKLAKLVDRIGQSPAGELYRQELIRRAEDGQEVLACPLVGSALNQLRDAEPYCCYCPYCETAHAGRADPRCKTCAGRGWTTRAAFERCSGREREQVLQLRSLAGR